MQENFLQKATDPHQYDAGTMDWKKEGLQDSPTRKFFQEYLEQNLDVKGKTVVDIGSGMGQLFPLLEKLGANRVSGIEPSKNNLKVSQELYPEVTVFGGTLDEVGLATKFDVAVSVMVFEHIANIESAFRKISEILNSAGTFYLICGDVEYNKTPRFGYEIETSQIDAHTIVSKIKRPLGLLYDILRRVEAYAKAGEESGFILHRHIEMRPTKNYITLEPKYAQFKDTTIAHLLVFKKKE